jgi:3-isopropylmalate dehydrogenase
VARYRIAVIGGDGVGPEVTGEAVKVLGAVADRFDFGLELTDYDLGAGRYLSTGEVLPRAVLDELAGHDAILLGAVGGPEVPPGVLERGLLLGMRKAFDQYVNLRPVKLYDGVTSPIAGLTSERCDLVVVRENTEGLYAGAGGVVHGGTPREVASEESLNTYAGVERVVRYAYAHAAARRGGLTLCHKANVLAHAGTLWQRVVDELGEEFPGVKADYVHVDAACLYLVMEPDRFDVVVTDNLFGDIITDVGAAVQGGLGVAASANLNPEGAAPSMFEPVHGSAPDIAGKGIANPTALVLSSALMLEHLGELDAARRVTRAVHRVIGAGQTVTSDLGGTASTSEYTDAVIAALG